MELIEMMGLAAVLAQEHDLSIDRVFRLIEQESGWQADIVNPTSKCAGLMQLNPRFYPGPLKDPEHNLRTGMPELARHLRNSDGDWVEALARWNWGEGYVANAKEAWGRWWLLHIPAETWFMVYKVLL
jgi:hypothetical protein